MLYAATRRWPVRDEKQVAGRMFTGWSGPV